MADGDLSATFILNNADQFDPIPDRVITLTAPTWQIKIGRGTASGDHDLKPSSSNAWFDSRVMSRHHAIVAANPDTKQFTIEDIGSMHGTYCNSRRLKANIPEPIYNGDSLVFGSDVTRGSSSFNALEVSFSAYWSDSSDPPPSSGWPALQSRNTFSADYSDDEIDENDDEDIETEQDHARQDMHTTTSPETDDIPYEDHDEGDLIEIIKESIRAPSVEVIIPPPYAESIADSEYPDSDGDFSIDEPQQPQSSPLATSDEDEAHKSAEASCSLLEPLSVPRHSTTTSSTDPVELSNYQTAMPMSMTYSIDDKATTNQVAPDAPRQPVQTRSGTTGSQAPADIIMLDNSRVDQGYLAPPFSHDGLRAPSPSDAAMAKPRPAAQDNSPFMRFDPYGDNHHQSEASTFKLTSTLPPLSRTPAWAGHNSILYDPMPQSTHYSSAYEFVGLDYGHVVPVAYRALESSAASPIVPSKDSESYDQNEAIYQDLYCTSSQHPKRKADEISDDAERSDSLPQPLSGAADPAQYHSTQAMAKDEETTSPADITVPVETAIIAVEVEQDDDAHPRKKMKIDPSPTAQRDRGKTFFKFAAATMAGFAIGTVGTIVGLASLPPDYFA